MSSFLEVQLTAMHLGWTGDLYGSLIRFDNISLELSVIMQSLHFTFLIFWTTFSH